MQVPQEIKNRTTVGSSNPTAGYLSKEYENMNLKRWPHPYAHHSIIYTRQDTETT